MRNPNPPSFLTRTLLTGASSALIFPLGYVSTDFNAWAARIYIGVIFGLLVLAPFTYRRTGWQLKSLGLAAGSAAIYALVVELAVQGYGALNLGATMAVVLSGVVGALLVGALMRLLLPLPLSLADWARLAGAGLLGGIVFSLLFESEHLVVVVLGFFAWQLAVFLVLYRASR